MEFRPLFLTTLLTTLALAGCADPPPSGDIGGGSAAVDLQGDAEVTFTEGQYPASATGEPTLYESLCAPEGSVPGGECVDPQTEARVMLHVAPQPNANGYVAYFVGSGDPAELEIGALSQGEDGMWLVENTFEGQDYDGVFEAVQVRMGPTVIATGPASGGSLTVPETLGGVTATGSYDGKALNVEVAGLSEDDSYMGWLIAPDEGGELAHTESFPVSNGPVEYTANNNIADYEEFHIHVAGSTVNIYKTTIA